MTSSREMYDIVHVIDVASTPLGNHRMFTYYDESNPFGAVGSVSISEQLRTKTCLGANCQLNAMWSSPEGHLWVVDDHGDVYTNADVSFSKPPFSGLNYNSGFYEIDWKVTEAFVGQLNGVWGCSDKDVWVTAFDGPVLHWDGSSWTKYMLTRAPNAINGSASDDVYVVGYEGNIHHWDGTAWSKVAFPEHIRPNEAFTDVRAISRDHVLITGRSGCLLRGNAREGFTDIGSAEYSWYGVGILGERVFLAGGPAGIFELIDDRFVCLKDKGHPVGVFETDGAVHFIPAEQQPNPWFVTYRPGAEREWTKVNT